MKILLLTVTAGYGHHATAKALADLFEQRGAETKIVDVYEYISKVVRTAISQGYLLSSKYTPELYRLFYTKTSKNREKLNKMNIVKIVNTLGAFKFEHFVDNFEPDAIVCTHVLAAHLISEMKNRHMVDAPCIGVVTDYCIHPYWEDVVNMEALVTASELITHTAVKRGIPEERILPLGIPIHPKFNRYISKEDACAELELDPERRTVLVMGGSMGYGNSRKLVRQITQLGLGCQILAVCGNNKRAYNRLKAFEQEYSGDCTLRVMGFVDNVELLMSAADCIITKPGGLTVSEAIAKGVPMILVNPIPGQEERNVEFLLNNGMASLVTKTFPLDDALYHLFHNPVRLRTVRESIRAIGHPDASEQLVNYVIGLVEQRQSNVQQVPDSESASGDALAGNGIT
ncbi:MGDG synthase family glycosyltransferase [Butyricicoccus sp.]|uniref:MGDG synthase family glycosyltransferase n=1 Tax=Butyricicoccus sp. TaxID=2049021 RepID=UPI003F151EE5